MPRALTAPAGPPTLRTAVDYLLWPHRLLPQSSQTSLQADEVDASDPDDGGSAAGDNSNTPELASASNTISGGVYALVKPLEDGDVELRAFRTGRSRNFCFRAPVVVSKSTRVSANAACPAKWTQLSCSCVAGMSSSDWVLRIKKRTSSASAGGSVNGTAPGNVSADAALAVSSIGIFMLPSNVASLELVGESATEGNPVDVALRLVYETNKVVASSAQLVLVDNVSALTTVEVSNIDLASVAISSDFLPANLVKISLHKCNLKVLEGDFLTKRHGDLQSLDLSNNSFTGIPSSLVTLPNLKQLDLRGNPISNRSVSKAQFAQLATLSVFEIDSPTISSPPLECTGGSVQNIGDAKFCVLAAGANGGAPSGSPTGSNTSKSSDDSSALYLGFGIPLVMLVFGALVFMARRNWWSCNRRSNFVDKPDSFDISLLERTDSQYMTTALTVNDALLQDPVIAMHRIPYRDVKLGECVSQGGFGVVYSGVYKRRRVAIKKIHVGQNREVLRVESFLREVVLMASLAHPRVVEFIGVAWDSLRNLSAVTEFMDRGDLRDVLQGFKKRGKSMTWDAHKMRIALQIAEAMAYLHSLVPTVIHRDLKSKNVLLDADLNAKLSDFGISREWTVDDTHMTVGIGTSFWIAPEVLLGKKYDERADIFSFGVVLNEIDTDDYPYWNVPGGVRGKENEILRMVAAGAIRPKFTAECPKGILLLADFCLNGDPKKRPTSAQLVQFLQQLLVSGTQSSSSSSSAESVQFLVSPVSEDSCFHDQL
ncbi:Tkl protein kinase [Globisporangium polare]